MSARRTLGVLAAPAVLAAMIAMAPWASAAGERAGDVVIVDENGQPISGGGTETVYAMRVPDGAACQGDSAYGGYRINTFLVPDGDDPGALVFDAAMMRPTGEGQWSIWKQSTDPALSLLTGVSGPDQPGPLVDLPRFTFDVGMFPGEIPSGEYRIGLACTLGNETTRYWDTSFTIAEGDGEPLVWSTAGSTPMSSTGPSPVVLVGLVALALVGVAAAFLVRRRSTADAPLISKEET